VKKMTDPSGEEEPDEYPNDVGTLMTRESESIGSKIKNLFYRDKD
jgi:hypothetical protein